jgi:CBS domain containing-hemolysin-like protein
VGSLLLLALNLYISLLAYALRGYSRGRLAERLPKETEKRWLDWLDEAENQLQVGASLSRLTCNLVVVLAAVGWFMVYPALPAWLAGAADGVLSEPAWIVLVGGVSALLVLMFTNIAVAHALAAHAGEEFLAWSLPLLRVARVGLYPAIRLIGGIEFVVRRLLGRAETSPEEENERIEEEILDAISEGRAFGAVDEEQEEMIEAVLALHDTAVSAIMTPRTDIVAIPATATEDEVRQLVTEAGHSRIPVTDGSLDQLVGVLYVKDLLRLQPGEQLSIAKLVRTVPYVPETKTIDELLREMRTRKVHIAIVVDEYGGTAGLVTIEDILEELVGEIDDEYDRYTPPPINHVDEDTIEVDARVHVSEINEELEIELPEDGDYETLGGFVFMKCGKIPAEGEEVIHENIQIKVISAEERKINRLRVHVAREQKRSA